MMESRYSLAADENPGTDIKINAKASSNHHIGDNDAGAGIDQIEVFDVHEHRNRDRLHRDHHT